MVWMMGSATILGQGTTQTIVVPYNRATQTGDIGDGGLFEGPTIRQQVWNSQYLAQAWDGPVLITGVAFRLDNGMPSTATVIPRVEIRFTTTQRNPENVSYLWDLNKGRDERTVLNRENYLLVATGGAGTNPFDVRFSFEDGFVYDPAAGNLLMYIETWSPTGQAFPNGRTIDAQSHFEAGLVGGSLTTPLHISLVTEFTWQAVPEPAAASLFFCGWFFYSNRDDLKYYVAIRWFA